MNCPKERGVISKAKTFWLTAIVVSVAGIVQGGPQKLDIVSSADFVGSDPPAEPCNGKEIEDRGCPNSIEAGFCTPGTWNSIKYELPGTNLYKRFNTGVAKCRITDDPYVCLNFYTLVHASTAPVCELKQAVEKKETAE